MSLVSIVRECDVCQKHFNPGDPGTMHIDVTAYFVKSADDLGCWDDIDLCPEHAAAVLAVIKPALQEFKE